jgi:hypothetical protein
LAKNVAGQQLSLNFGKSFRREGVVGKASLSNVIVEGNGMRGEGSGRGGTRIRELAAAVDPYSTSTPSSGMETSIARLLSLHSTFTVMKILVRRYAFASIKPPEPSIDGRVLAYTIPHLFRINIGLWS